MTLLRHGGFVPSCEVVDAHGARHGAELLDRRGQCAPGHFWHALGVDHRSDVGHVVSTASMRLERQRRELRRTCIEKVIFCCKELA